MDDSPSPLPLTKRSRPAKDSDKSDKACSVCGDMALGYNFGAVSCESCKAFFRRNAVKNQMKCQFERSCEIDLKTRRFCSFCRLQKCFAVGMRKDLILGVEERQRRWKNTTARGRRRPLPGRDPANLLTLQAAARGATGYDNDMYRQLMMDETRMLNDLKQTYEMSFCVQLEPMTHIPPDMNSPTLNVLVNQSSITILRMIKFAKKIPEFSELTSECQIGILKGCWMHILLLRSVSLYNIDRDVWASCRGDLPTTIVKNGTGLDTLHEQLVQFCRLMKSVTGDDIVIIILLLIIVIFAPEASNVASRQHVSSVQDKYLVLLKHHLEAHYSYVEAARMFAELLVQLRDMKRMAETHGTLLLNVNPKEIEPIMLEILDLK